MKYPRISWKMGGGEGGRCFSALPTPFCCRLQGSDQTFKDDVSGFSLLQILLHSFCFLSSGERDRRKRPTVLQYNWDRTYSTSIVKLPFLQKEEENWLQVQNLVDSWLDILYKITSILSEYQLHLHSNWLTIIYLDSDSVMILHPDLFGWSFLPGIWLVDDSLRGFWFSNDFLPGFWVERWARLSDGSMDSDSVVIV